MKEEISDKKLCDVAGDIISRAICYDNELTTKPGEFIQKFCTSVKHIDKLRAKHFTRPESPR